MTELLEDMEMDPIEAEVDAIRKQLWEETKHMTPEERIADLIRRTEPIMKQFHIKTSKLKPAELKKGSLKFLAGPYEDYDSL